MNIENKLIEAHIFRRNGEYLEFLALKRSSDVYFPNIWQMVTGAIKQNEKAYETAIREIKEETGLIPQKIWALPNVNSFYSVKDDAILMIPVFVAEVSFNSNVFISGEHSEYRWLKKNEMIDCLAWPGQKQSVEILCEYFQNENEYINLVEIKIN